jgi:hypothetical protein
MHRTRLLTPAVARCGNSADTLASAVLHGDFAAAAPEPACTEATCAAAGLLQVDDPTEWLLRETLLRLLENDTVAA